MNAYDSERVGALLTARGWVSVDDPREARLLIVNTCSVREKPAQKVFSFVGRFLTDKERKGMRIFVMGCVAQQMGADLPAQAPIIDGVFGPGCEAAIPDAAEGDRFPVVMTDPAALTDRELFPPVYDTLWRGARSAFVTVMHGCDNHCSYCIVPSVRGGEVSRASGTILEEVRALVAAGIREVTLLGQNVNSYRDPAAGLDFTGLLYLLADRSGLDRIRFVTSHPRDLTPALAAAFAEIPSLMPYLHLPAQSGSDRILALMNRGYSVKEYLEKIAWVRERCPDISLSGDFIVGFPGETESEFEETLLLIETVRYDTLFAFKYSPRPGTVAARVPETLTDGERSERLDRLLTLQRAVMGTVRRRFLDRVVTVLIESRSPRGDTVMGRSEHNQIVHVAGDPLPAEGSLVPVRVTEVLENTLRGRVCDTTEEGR